jgi:hypothetical protein
VLFPPHQPNCKKNRRNSSATRSNNTPTDASSVSEGVCQEDSKVTRRERKKAKKAGNGAVKGRLGMNIITNEDIDFVSEAIHLAKHESKGAWEGTYIYNHKQTELEKKEGNMEEGEVVDSEDLKNPKHCSRSGSFAVKRSVDMTPRQRRIVKKFYTPVQHSSFGGGSRKFSPRSHQFTDVYHGVNPTIFFRLGVELEFPVQNTKERRELVAKLVTAVKEDMEVVNREEKETQMRAEGFWRWAGTTAYQNIMRTRDTLDWATGQKIITPPQKRKATIEQQIELENEEDEGTLATSKAETPVTLEIVAVNLNEDKEGKAYYNLPGAWQAVTKRGRVTKVPRAND